MLRGYDLNQTSDSLKLTLHWQALRRIERNYKVFVHLSPVEGDALVAQHDAIPRDWSYPTLWWDEGEFVTDTVTLDIAEVGPGSYEIALGMYDASTLERLPVTDRSGAKLPDHQLVLPAITLEAQ